MPIARSTRGPPLLSPTQQKVERPPVDAADLCVGCIVWLPRKSPCRKLTSSSSSSSDCIRCSRLAGCCGNQKLDGGGYNHPVVVLGIRQRKGSSVVGDLECVVACITSFGNTDLATYLQTRTTQEEPHLRTHRQDTQSSIPILHSTSCTYTPNTTYPHTQLSLQAGKSLQKQSYIRTQHFYTVPLSFLRTFDSHHHCPAYKLRLDEISYGILMRVLNLPVERYEDTDSLYETAGRGLEALRRAAGLPEDALARGVKEAEVLMLGLGRGEGSRRTETVACSSFSSSSLTKSHAKGGFGNGHCQDVERCLSQDRRLVGTSSGSGFGYGRRPIDTSRYYEVDANHGGGEEEKEELPGFVKILLGVAWVSVVGVGLWLLFW